MLRIGFGKKPNILLYIPNVRTRGALPREAETMLVDKAPVGDEPSSRLLGENGIANTVLQEYLSVVEEEFLQRCRACFGQTYEED